MIDALSIKRLFVRTPFERPLKLLHGLLGLPQRLKHPELSEIWDEPERIEQLLATWLGPDSNCIDVGCHIGSVLSSILRLAPRGRHVAFEPVPRKAAWLRQKFPEVDVREMALSDSAGEVVFFEDIDRPGFSGLASSQAGRVRELRVRCNRLDDELGGSRVEFLKVDVEGAELMVFKGAQKILEASHPKIIFESACDGAEKFGLSNQALYEFLVGLGYSIHLPKDALGDGRPLAIDEFMASHRYPFKAFNYIAL